MRHFDTKVNNTRFVFLYQGCFCYHNKQIKNTSDAYYVKSFNTGYFLSFDVFFPKLTFSKKEHSINTVRVSNSFNQDLSGRLVGSDLYPNYLQLLWADPNSRQRINCQTYHSKGCFELTDG